MFKKDTFIKGFLIGLVINVIAVGIVWFLVEKIGISQMKNPSKLYLLTAIPAILFMWYCMRIKKCVKIGIGTLFSIIILVLLFFLFVM